eukprot:3940357-Rhodomonas_salina.1
MSGTDMPYAATRYPVLRYRMLLCHVRYRMVLRGIRYCATAAVLAAGPRKRKKEGGEGEREGEGARECGTAEIAYGATRYPLCHVRYWHSVCCYAMYGAEIAYAAMPCPVLAYRMLLRGIRYAMSGTEIAYGATPCPVPYGATRCPRMLLCHVRYWHTVWCYAVSGTAYRMVLCHVRYRMVLCHVRYWHSICCYAMSGTEIAYAAMPCP